MGPKVRRAGARLYAGGLVFALVTLAAGVRWLSTAPETATSNIALTASSVVWPASPGPASAPGPLAGGSWRPIFSQTFPGTSIDPNVWDTCYPWFPHGNTAGCTNFGNSEEEWYLPGQDVVSGGLLHLDAAEVPTEGATRLGTPRSYPWRSGMVTTYGSLSFTYGLVQVVAKLPAGDGFWPAIWMLPTVRSWPPEIDILENYGKDPTTAYFTNVYSNSVLGRRQYRASRTVADLSTGFNTFGVDWEPSGITWYVDGAAVASTADHVPSQPMYLLVNLAVADSAGFAPNATTPPRASMEVRSVTVWQHP